MKTQKRFLISGSLLPFSMAAFKDDAPEIVTEIDNLSIGESWHYANGSETVTRIEDAVDELEAGILLQNMSRRRNGQFGFCRFFTELYVSDPNNVFDLMSMHARHA